MRWLFLLLVVSMTLIGACATRRPCAERSGSYAVTFDRRDGNCGEIPEAVLVMGGSSSTVSGCSGASPASADNCEVQFDVTCPVRGGGTRTERGAGSWSRDGKSGRTTQQVILSTPSSSCSGTYNVTYRKL